MSGRWASGRISQALAIVLACAAITLSINGRSRAWLHTTHGLHVWYHVVLFAVLGVLCMCSSRRTSGRWLGFIAALLLGFGIEWSQAVGNHVGIEWADVRSDVCGIACGALVGWLLSRRYFRRALALRQ